MVVNRQREVFVDVRRVRHYVQRLRQRLKLGRQTFSLCFVDDQQMLRLNSLYRGKPWSTDVLSFRWTEDRGGTGPTATCASPTLNPEPRDFAGCRFLGELVISAAAARRNARAEGHTTANEVEWLILHGLLHLLGYDHESDNGEMTALEFTLRDKLGLNGSATAGQKHRASTGAGAKRRRQRSRTSRMSGTLRHGRELPRPQCECP